MGRELQKKKNRSSIPKIKIKQKSKSAKKRINPLGNAIIAANWYVYDTHESSRSLTICRNKEETLSQNYRRLGLSSRLNSATGGIEKSSTSKTSTPNRLSISQAQPTELIPTEARVERDPETGKIIRVIHTKKPKDNPLHDPLMSDSEEEFGGFDDEPTEKSEVVRQLEEQAQMIAEKKPRKQSQREQEWVERLVNRYGDDYQKMARDMKLNPMQQTATDIGRRVQKWRSEGGTA